MVLFLPFFYLRARWARFGSVDGVALAAKTKFRPTLGTIEKKIFLVIPLARSARMPDGEERLKVLGGKVQALWYASASNARTVEKIGRGEDRPASERSENSGASFEFPADMRPSTRFSFSLPSSKTFGGSYLDCEHRCT